ncbi:MAG: NifB/NifX family molybdenum-iron cluster-binding protein [Bacteroidaceae bacterium]|nr:hypothetical protein [Bacteroidaceae bacterium]
MKVVITSSGSTLQDKVDARFGRCPFFVFYDTDNKQTEILPNPNMDADEGAGPAAVRFVASRNVKKSISGEFGFKIKSLMDSAGIQMIVVKADKTVKEIIDLLNN